MVSIKKMIGFAANYAIACVEEYIDWVYKKTVNTLPPNVYPQIATFRMNIMDSESECNSDDSLSINDESVEIVIFSVVLSVLTLDNERYDVNLASAQLLAITDDDGTIKINDILRFYPDSTSIEIVYFRKNGTEYDKFVKTIDLITRTDVRSEKKCKFGRIQL